MEKPNPNEKEYCLCRFPSANEMIMCESCEEWFHQECLGIKQNQAKAIKDFYCLGCCKKLNKEYLPDIVTDFIWNDYEKITMESF